MSCIILIFLIFAFLPFHTIWHYGMESCDGSLINICHLSHILIMMPNKTYYLMLRLIQFALSVLRPDLFLKIRLTVFC